MLFALAAGQGFSELWGQRLQGSGDRLVEFVPTSTGPEAASWVNPSRGPHRRCCYSRWQTVRRCCSGGQSLGTGGEAPGMALVLLGPVRHMRLPSRVGRGGLPQDGLALQPLLLGWALADSSTNSAHLCPN